MREMKVLIETYRGWEISFDTEKEEFYCLSNEYDNDKTKKSYASAKKYIDDYIKDNQEFKPVRFMQYYRNFYSNDKYITLVGIRKDGAFIQENENGEKSQLSKYNESDYFMVNSANNPILEELSKLDEQEKAITEKQKELRNQLIKFTVKDYRKQLEGHE